eukprot:snap_masked-scaffold_23-processed-gene-5.34-mRNA-1 protein AED:1.00 eAED:1.00 QI:0/-1/0/0/-1/1/1/0/67
MHSILESFYSGKIPSEKKFLSIGENVLMIAISDLNLKKLSQLNSIQFSHSSMTTINYADRISFEYSN